MRVKIAGSVVVAVAVCVLALAQDQELLPNAPAQHPAIPTVTFQLEFPGAVPSHYAISVDATGRAAYSSTAPQDENSGFAVPGKQPAGEPYTTKFVIGQSTVDHVFQTAARLKYFEGNFDYTKTRVANTGNKTLIYADLPRHFQTTFNWSQNTDIMELTRLFQGLSSTLEFDRKMQFDQRYQKLALEDDLKQIQDAAGRGNLTEAQLLRPTLQKIANDSSVMHIARKRAQALLDSMPQ